MAEQVPQDPVAGAVAAAIADDPVLAVPAAVQAAQPVQAAPQNNALNAIPAIPAVVPEGLDELRLKIEALQSTLNTSKVDQALESVRHLASRPFPLLDSFALLASLEQLADCARDSNHPERKKYDAILKQCRPIADPNSLAQVVQQLLGDKEERDVATQIRKIFKGNPPSKMTESVYDYSGSSYRAPPTAPDRYRGGHFVDRGRGFRPSPYSVRPRQCFNCRGIGHFARNCPHSVRK
ncbi:regulation of collagen catabolic process [Desmophyllum pertusum]|uniref:Regulation of collagen catabolic process n=1 Tax=Desmophyllum pertusum TaxID=174260 RepID=A0A9W9ZNK7_9CNID|nr:regulation of collagen catabolic process [Desmophyllum pertusum]